MTELTTQTAQSLHAAWCRQMREKGWHGPDEACTYGPEDSSEIDDNFGLFAGVQEDCNDGDSRCEKFDGGVVPWPDLPEPRRQEYLATAKAVLPEIVGEIVEDCTKALVFMRDEAEVKYAEAGGIGRAPYEHGAAAGLIAAIAEIRALRDRRLEELE